jgi:tetratricopeptide (TPR) repeat protein
VAFAVSYDRLSPETQQAFRRWGIVPGPDFTVDVAATLLPHLDPGAAELLNRLTRAHLLERRGRARYRFHDLVRRYALERFQAAEGAADRAAAYAALFTHYLDSTDGAISRLAPQVTRLPYTARVDWADRFPTARAAGTWIDEELANLLAAAQAAGAYGYPETAWLLADRLRIYFWSRRRMAEWLDNARVGLAAAQRAGSAAGESAARLSLGQSYSTVSNYDAAISELQSALTAAREAGWSEGEAASLGILGTVCREAGRLGEAAEFYRQARALYRDSGTRGGEAIALANLGAVNWEVGRLVESAADSNDALTIFEDLDNQDAVCITLNNLAMASLDAGALAEAEAYTNRALQIAEQFDSSAGRAQGRDTMALVQVGMRRLEDAARNASMALRSAQDIGDRRIEISVLNTLGMISLLKGEWDDAVGRFQDAQAKASDTGHVRGRADALIGLALAQLNTDISQAMANVTRARDLARSFGFALIVAHSYVVEGRIHARLGDITQAWTCCVTALTTLRGTGARALQLEAVELLWQLRNDSDALPSGPGLTNTIDELTLIPMIPAATELRAALIGTLNIEERTVQDQVDP